MERVHRLEAQRPARRPAAEPDERSAPTAQSRGGGTPIQAMRPGRSVASAIGSGGHAVVQRLGDAVILAELPYWDMRADYGYVDEVARDDILMGFFRAFDTLPDLQGWLTETFGARLAAALPTTPPVTPLQAPTASPSLTPSIGSNSAPPPSPTPLVGSAQSSASAPAPRAASPSSNSNTSSGPQPVTAPPRSFLNFASAATRGSSSMSAPAAAAPAGPSVRAQDAIRRLGNWSPSHHGGYKDLSLSSRDLQDIEASLDHRFNVIYGPGDGAEYSGFQQMKIIHAMASKIDGQSPTFHISYRRI